MTAGIHDGWTVALHALGALIGALPVIAVIALVITGLALATRQAGHRLRVQRIRRSARRSGRGLNLGPSRRPVIR